MRLAEQLKPRVFEFLGLTEEQLAAKPRERAWGLLSLAKSDVKIIAGELNPDFYRDPTTLKIIREKVKAGVTFQIIAGPNANQESVDALKEAGGERLAIAQVPVRPHHHFMLADGKHTLVENYHRPGAPLRERDIDFRKNNGYLAGDLEADFNYLWYEKIPATKPQENKPSV